MCLVTIVCRVPPYGRTKMHSRFSRRESKLAFREFPRHRIAARSTLWNLHDPTSKSLFGVGAPQQITYQAKVLNCTDGFPMAITSWRPAAATHGGNNSHAE